MKRDDSTVRSEVRAGVVALLLALAQERLAHTSFFDGKAAAGAEAANVLGGHPTWRVFQNRVLGPLLVAVVERIAPDERAAYTIFSVVTLTVAGWLAWRLGRTAGLLVFELGFALLLSSPWLYAWDYVGAIASLLFAGFVVARRPWPWFVALFAVAIFNRESAEAIALWMIVDPIARWALARRRGERPRIDAPMFVAGVSCFAAGVAITLALRRWLFVAESGPALFPRAAARAGPELHFRLLENVSALRDGASWARLDFVVVIFVAVAVAALVRLARLDADRLLGLALAYGALLAATITFAVAYETRVYVELLPVFVLTSYFTGGGGGIDTMWRSSPPGYM